MQLFRSLQYPNFRLHTIGQSISLLGTWMQRIAISWLVYRLTDSVFWLGFVSFISLSPSLFLSPFIGSFVDGRSRYRMLFTTQCLLMVQAGLLTLFVFLGWESVLWLCVLGFWEGVANGFDVLSGRELLPALVGKKKVMPQGIALTAWVFDLAGMGGPALGGILLGMYGELLCCFVEV